MVVPSLKLSSGTLMPILGLGTWKSKPGQVVNAVKAAIDAGYRHIDCAWIYGNEPEVGAGLKAKFSDGTVKREDLFITSKHDGKCDKFPKDDQGNIQYSDDSYLETWKALEKAMDDGLVKSIGLSNFNRRQITEVVSQARIKPAVLQVEIHPYMSQEPLVKFCKENNIVVTAYSPLGSPDRPWASPDEALLLEDPKLIEISKKYAKSPAQVIIRWLIQREIVVIPKSVTPSRIIENFSVWDFQLTDADMAVVSGFNRDCRFVVSCITVNGKREFRDRDAPNFPFVDKY